MRPVPVITVVKVLTSIILLLIFIDASAQTGEIIPPSPSMSTLQRFTDYPVNYSTGLVDITIPLYEIKLKGYSYPISIKFHAGGRKWSSNFSSMGVGWSLDATGFVSREIRERPDHMYVALEMTRDSLDARTTNNIELGYDRLVSADMNVPNGYNPVNGSSESYKEDSQHDVFTYNANGISGKFILDRSGQAFPLTYNNLRITASGSTGGCCIINDEQGNVYTFGSVVNSTETVWNTVKFGSSFIQTGSNLSKIERPSGETITFAYNQLRTDAPGAPVIDRLNYTTVNIGTTNFQGMYGQDAEIQDYFNNLQGYRYRDMTSYNHYDITLPTQINFPNGKVTFDYNSQSLLTGFHVFDVDNREVRSGTFTYMTTPGTSGTFSPSFKNSLQNLVIKNDAGQQEMVYSFDYYNDALPVNSSNNFAPNIDWWGYCNSTGSNTPPYDPADPLTGGYVIGVVPAAKEPNILAVRSGMLKKIHYPTGGTTEFIYELNQYHDGNVAPRNGPGLRIKQVISDDGGGVNKLTKYYKYGPVENGSENGKGYLHRVPNVNDFRFERFYNVYTTTGFQGFTYSIMSYFPQAITSMQEAYSQPVYYEKVTEYTLADNGVSNGKTIYTFSLPQYYFSGTSFRKKEWTGGLLLNKSTYSSDQVATPKETVSYGYTQLHYRKIPQLQIWRQLFAKFEDQFNVRQWERKYAKLGSPVFIYYDLPYESAVMKQTLVTQSLDGTTTSTLTRYDNLNYVSPTSVVKEGSNGEYVSEETKYTFDFQSPFFNLLQKNWLLPVETSVYKMTDALGANKRLLSSEYRTINTSNGLADKIYRIESTSPLTNFVPAFAGTPPSTTITKDNRYVESYVVDLYGSKGNILQAHKTDDLNTAYLWDATITYPIAKVTGVSFWDISSLNGRPANYNSVTLYSQLKALVPSAFIQTYSYNSLIGMTSQTDATGRTTYFKYDSFGRLESISDNDGKILKMFSYHYKNQ